MAAPVKVSHTENSVEGDSSLTLTKPASVATGDLLIILVGNDADTATAQWDNSTYKPTGFTLIKEAGSQEPGGGETHVAAFYRIADGTEGATINVPAQSSNDYFGWYIRVTGADGTTPIHVTGATYEAESATSHAVTQLTTTKDDCLIFAVFSGDGADIDPYSVSGTGWSEEDEIEVPTSGGGQGASGCWASKTLSTAGASVNCTFGLSASDGGTGFQFAIAPEANVTVTPGTAAIAVTGFAPAPQLGINASSLADPGVVAGSVSVNVELTPPPALLTMSGFAPTITASFTITPGFAALALIGYPPDVSVAGAGSPSVTPGVGQLVLTGYAPTVTGAPVAEVRRRRAASTFVQLRKV